MTDLIQKLEAAQTLTDGMAEKLYGHNSLSSMAEGVWMPQGAKAEADRRAPLDKALRDCIRTLQEYRDDDFNAEADAPSSAALALSSLQRVIEGVGK